MSYNFQIDPDISKAETLPASFYTDPKIFEALKQTVFYKTWQWIGDTDQLREGQNSYPFVLLDGFLNEPMLLTKDAKDTMHCLTNVCTHRGNLLVGAPGKTKNWSVDTMGDASVLTEVLNTCRNSRKQKTFRDLVIVYTNFLYDNGDLFLFAGLNPSFDFQEVLDIMGKRVGFMNLKEFKLDESRGKDYFVNAHWALYCDNFLEGFHIPFVHDDLDELLDYGNYDTVLYEHVNLQIGYADDSTETVFDFPKDHVDHGKKIAAYYYWVFPNMMFNFYPWGCSVNLVQPIGMNRTKVSFYSYVLDASKLDKGAGAGLDTVELEDEEVVEGVQQGVRSQFYKAGRFSPTREKGYTIFIASWRNF